MLDLQPFRNKIPGVDALVPRLREWIGDPKSSLEHVQDLVSGHLEKAGSKEAAVMAYNIIEHIIGALEVTEVNYRRLLEFIDGFDSFQAYARLINDFGKFMKKGEREALMEEGREMFGEEITLDWE